jgi:uncharacterized protein
MRKDRSVADRSGSILAGWAALALVALVTAPAAGSPAAEGAYRQEIEAWQKQRITRLTSDEGWLVVSGLTWLKPGPNPFGSAPSNSVVLPGHSVPPKAGVLVLQGDRVSIELLPGTRATLRVGTEEKPLGKAELRDDVPGPYDVVAIGDVRFFVIDREGRMGIRVRDLRSPRRTEWKGLQYFSIDAGYRVVARFVPHAQPVKIKVPSVLGGTTDMVSPGRLHFRLGNQDLSLDPVIEEEGDQRLFVIFRDSTAGKQTYGAGRFVYTDLPKDDKVVLDFNKAYTPPCAFTAYATCPLPPPQNRLKVAIPAGEKFADRH